MPLSRSVSASVVSLDDGKEQSGGDGGVVRGVRGGGPGMVGREWCAGEWWVNLHLREEPPTLLMPLIESEEPLAGGV